MSGMEPAVAGLFAFATPLELLLIWGSMVILDIHPDLPEARDLGLFLLVGLIAATASSLATLIWNQTRALDLVTGQRVWQGWLIGDLAQLWLLTPPLLHWLGAPARRWIDRQIGVPPRQRISYTRSVVVLLVALGMLGALVFQGVGMAIETLGAAEGLVRPGGEPLLERFGEIGLFLGLLFGVTLLTTFLFTSALARMGERARRESLRDMLTGCYNRRAFPDLFQRESERSRRLGQGIAIVFFDVDRFKEINDAYGHEVGDRLLRLLPYRVRGVMREHDLLFRWGGEEFVAVLPHTSPGDAARLADRIRKAVAEQPLVTEYVPRPISVTVSVGAAGAREYPVDPDRLIAAADAACLRAKREGRDRVVAAGDDPQSGRPSPAVPHAIP
jgi:diguanylate cyclase (GGDEF)-like protein